MPGPSSASCSSRCGSSSSRACATGTASSTSNDPQLTAIQALYGIDYRHTLAELIELNTGVTQPDVFKAAG